MFIDISLLIATARGQGIFEKNVFQRLDLKLGKKIKPDLLSDKGLFEAAMPPEAIDDFARPFAGRTIRMLSSEEINAASAPVTGSYFLIRKNR